MFLNAALTGKIVFFAEKDCKKLNIVVPNYQEQKKSFTAIGRKDFYFITEVLKRAKRPAK
jgi:hypothetical protein